MQYRDDTLDTIRRLILVFAFACAAAAEAPPPDSWAWLEQDVLKANTEWQVLAKDLDARVDRMLPCDPRAKTALDDVIKASQNRLAALARYYQAATALAANRAEGAKRLVIAEEGRAADIAADNLHGDDVLAVVETALADLAEGARVEPTLAAARAAFEKTAALA